MNTDPTHRPHIRITPVLIKVTPVIPSPAALEHAAKHVDLWIEEERGEATVYLFEEVAWADEINPDVDRATGMMNLERSAKKVRTNLLTRVARAFDEFTAPFLSTINTLSIAAEELKEANESVGTTAGEVLALLQDFNFGPKELAQAITLLESLTQKETDE